MKRTYACFRRSTSRKTKKLQCRSSCTREDFLETMDVVGKVGYDSAFTFIYSKRSGTPAAAKENQVPEEVVKDRFDRLLAQVPGNCTRTFFPF